MRKLVILGVSLAFAVACAPRTRRDPTAPSGQEQNLVPDADAHLAAAHALSASGNHLAAGRSFEAALAAGGDESVILPHLLASQIRSGRLLAARVSARRLASVRAEWKGLTELIELLEQLPRATRQREPVE